MHDTDMAGILYFARQFRFAHDTFEDFLESEGVHMDRTFREGKFVFVIVHAEADYLISLRVGDPLEIHLSFERIGTTSFTVAYKIFRLPTQELVGTVKTVHVCIDSKTRTKCPLSEAFLPSLKKYAVHNST